MNKKIINVLTIFLVIIVTLFVLTKYSNAEYKYITGQNGKKIILGDVTGDGNIDNKDYYAMINHLIAKTNGNNSNKLTGNKLLAGDIVKDKYNDILLNDILAMRRYLAAKNNSPLANKEWLKILEKEETSKKQVTQTSKTNSKINPTGISITKTAKIKIGETKKLTATITPTNATNKTVYWESVQTDIAKVDSLGIVTGIKAGRAEIKAKTVNGKIAICIVKVEGTTTNNNNKTTNNNNNNKVAETTLTLEKNNITLYQNETTRIKANIKNGKSGDSVQWKSSNENIAIVDKIGRVKAIKPGNAIITAKTTKSNKMAECRINIPQTTLRINKTKISLNKGTSLTLSATATNKATNDKINWKSSNENVAKVNNGKVTAIGAGKATIIATTSVTGKASSTTVTVKVPESNSTEIKLNITNVLLDLSGTKTTKLVATVLPETTPNKNVTWTSSNNSIVQVDGDGNVIAKANGTAIITAKTENEKTAKCNITVQTSPTGIAIKDHTNKTEGEIMVHITRNEKFTPIITPSNANVHNKVTWTSSNTNVAKITDGVITPVSNGTVTLTAKTANGKKATRTVRIRTTVLFIGNSKTYFNNMPKIFASLAATAGKNVIVKSATVGGKSLNSLYNEEKVKNAINASYIYDYVILQGQPSGESEDAITTGAKKIVTDLKNKRNSNIRVIYNATWKYKNLNLKELEKSNSQYSDAKKATDNITTTKAKLVYTGNVIAKRKAVFSNWTEKNWFVDERHPSCIGSYLSACCIYSAIFNESPEGIKFYKAWDQRNNKNEVTIKESTAKSIQKYSGMYWNKTLKDLNLN